MICFLPTSCRITTAPSCIACQPGYAKRMIRISTVRTAVLSSGFFDGQIGQHEQREGHDGPELAPGESENLLPFADLRDESEERHGQAEIQKALSNRENHRQHIRCQSEWLR